MSVAIGIDLGTTNTVVAAVVDGVAVTLEDDKGHRLLPSVVSFLPAGGVVVGEPARDRRLDDPENTIFSVKPLLGRGWDSPEAQAARQRFPFKLVQGAKSSTMIEVRGTIYALPEISAFVLRRAKAIAEAALRQPVEKAVITVPANFNDLQRASTKIAGKLAGLDVMRILNEPTAAALAYGQSIKTAEKIAVYDLGGGTFDITLLDLTNSVFEVLATAGDTALGGDDVDRLIADKIIQDVQKRLKLDPRGNPASLARIAFLAEVIKKELSANEKFERELEGVAHKSNGTAMSIPFKLTRMELEQLAQPLLQRTINVAQQSMTAVGLTAADFERIILVGGATRMPLVARVVEGIFGKKPALKVNPDEVVALGAAIQAHALNRSKAAHKMPPKPPPVPKKPPPPPPPSSRVPKAASSSQQLPAYRPASSSKTPAVRPASKPQMQAVSKPPASKPQPPPLPPRANAKPAPAPPPPTPPKAEGEFFSFSKGTATISWDLPPSNPPPPPVQAPPPVVPPPPPSAPRSGSFAQPIDELDVPDFDMPMEAGPNDIVAAPDLDLEFGLDLPSTSQVPNPPKFDDPIDAPLTEGEQFGEFDLAEAFTPERFDQGSAIQTSAQTPLLIDVTPLSLGVETVGGYADVLIPANSPVPCEKSRTFLTANDGQSSVTIRVAQGESSKFAMNTRLGDLELSGLRRAHRGEVKIAVTFELDADGILNVKARDPDTGQETVATMRLVGATAEAEDLGAMAERQARHSVQ